MQPAELERDHDPLCFEAAVHAIAGLEGSVVPSGSISMSSPNMIPASMKSSSFTSTSSKMENVTSTCLVSTK